MTLKNLGSHETAFNYTLDGDAGVSYISRYATIQMWSGDPLYWFIREIGFDASHEFSFDVPPLEFMFDANGRLSSVSVMIAGNVEMCSTPPLTVQKLHPEAVLPQVDLTPWKKSETNTIDEIAKVQAWWSSDALWVVRAGAIPSSYFDTKAEIQVLFDEARSFIGMVVNSMRDEQKHVERSAKR